MVEHPSEVDFRDEHIKALKQRITELEAERDNIEKLNERNVRQANESFARVQQLEAENKQLNDVIRVTRDGLEVVQLLQKKIDTERRSNSKLPIPTYEASIGYLSPDCVDIFFDESKDGSWCKSEYVIELERIHEEQVSRLLAEIAKLREANAKITAEISRQMERNTITVILDQMTDIEIESYLARRRGSDKERSNDEDSR